MNAGIVRALLVAASVGTLASRPASADGALRHEGKTLEEWARALKAKQLGERAERALEALARARFLVGADAVALPAIEGVLRRGRFGPWYQAVDAAAAYGPLAEHLDPLLAPQPDLPPASYQVMARIRIGRDVSSSVAEIDRRLRAARDLYLSDSTIENLVELGDEVRGTRELGLRAHPFVPLVMEMLEDPRTRTLDDDVLRAATTWGPIAAPAAGHLVPFAKDQDESRREEAAAALAHLRNLDPEQDRAFFTAAKEAVDRGNYTLRVVRGVAQVMEHDRERSLTFLRARIGPAKPDLSGWANAGLARRVEGPERDRVLAALRLLAKHANVDARVGAMEGLWVLRDLLEPADLVALETALADIDLRVRWRAAAILLVRGQGSQESALAELARGIDSPDDEDRIAAFDTISTVGPKGAGLAERLRRWTNVPFEWIRANAARALEAVTAGR